MMGSVLAFLFAILGAVMSHWAHTGIEEGDHQRREWARTVGPIMIGSALVAWVLTMIIGGK